MIKDNEISQTASHIKRMIDYALEDHRLKEMPYSATLKLSVKETIQKWEEIIKAEERQINEVLGLNSLIQGEVKR